MTYKVKIDISPNNTGEDVVSALGAIARNDMYAIEGVVVSVNSIYYESTEHFAHAINSMFESAGLDVRAHPWYNEA